MFCVVVCRATDGWLRLLDSVACQGSRPGGVAGELVSIEHIHSEEELTAALEQPRAVLYKHSTRCGISTRTLREVERFAEQVPDVPVYVIDVISDRDLSNAIADRFEIRHQSPQVVVLENGEPIWHASHFLISARRLEKEVR